MSCFPWLRVHKAPLSTYQVLDCQVWNTPTGVIVTVVEKKQVDRSYK